MKHQDAKNHAQLVPGYHYLLSLLVVLVLILSFISLKVVWYPHDSFLRGGIIPVITSISLVLLFWYVRVFALKAQDRAIRAEEHLRYFILTGKPIDKTITMSQIIALRFASDEEFVALTQKAAQEKMSPKDIKFAIKNWRADHHRC